MEPLAGVRLAVIGAGKMGGALVRGWVKSGALSGSQITLANRRRQTADTLAREVGASAFDTPAQAVKNATVVLVAVKPHLVVPTLTSFADGLRPGCLVVSAAAGVRLSVLEANVSHETLVVRVMPNTPALVGEAASAFCRGADAGDDHAALVTALFGAVGKVVEVTEAQLDAVIGVSGSGVAYLYLIIEALIDGGVRAGLPREVARTLAVQTALGAARMVGETGEHPAVLKDAVTTPGGTTIAALEILEKAGMRGTIIEAVLAAQKRAGEMG